MMPYCKVETSYPNAEPGYKRIMFVLDPKGEDAEREEYMLQLIPGRTLELSRSDSTNRRLEGTIEQHIVDGSDAPYFHVKLAEESVPADMDVDHGYISEKVFTFVSMTSPTLFPYTSRYPVVVYLPEEADLRYNIWFGGQTMESITG